MRAFALTLGLGLMSVLVACDSGTSDGSTPTSDGSTPTDGAVTGPSLEAATLKQCDGTDFDLLAEVAKAKVTYITWGAGWCSACEKEVPIINTDIVEGFAGQPVQAMQILIENGPGEAPPLPLCEQWVNNLGAEFTVLADVEQVTVPQYFSEGIGTLPRHMLITEDGVIVFDAFGAYPTDLVQRIQDWL